MRALAALLLVAVLAGCAEDGVDVDAGGPLGAATEAAPPPATGPTSLWLSAPRVQMTGADVVSVLLQEGSFGQAATVDRWDGEGWVPHRQVALGYGYGQLRPLDEPLDGVDVEIGLGLSGVGDPLELRIEGLDVGWYRLRQVARQGQEATGTFEVVDGEVDLAPLGDDDVFALSVEPVLVRHDGGAVSVRLGGPGLGDVEVLAERFATLSPSGAVERWADGAWLQVEDVPLEPVLDEELVTESTARIPELEPGAYRLVRTLPDGTPVAGSFWVPEPGVLPIPAPEDAVAPDKPEPAPPNPPTTSGAPAGRVRSGGLEVFPSSARPTDDRLPPPAGGRGSSVTRRPRRSQSDGRAVERPGNQ